MVRSKIEHIGQLHLLLLGGMRPVVDFGESSDVDSIAHSSEDGEGDGVIVLSCEGLANLSLMLPCSFDKAL